MRPPRGNSTESRAANRRMGVIRAWSPALAWLLLFLTTSAAETQLPGVAPEVRSVIPLGAQRGESVEVRIRGKNLDDTLGLCFARKDIKAAVVASDFYEVRARIEVGASVPIGLYDYRLRTPRGSLLGVFHVSDLPQQFEAEPNNDLEHAQNVSTPVLIDGIVEEGDYDLFRFHAEAGETVVADLMATRAASPLDATLAILDQYGNGLDFNDDYYMSKDPHLTFTASRTGEYLVRVSGNEEAGSSDSSYRLVIGSVPLMHRVLPLGAQRGRTAEFELYGTNLGKVKKIVLGDSLAVGKVLEATPGRLRFRLSVPTELSPDRYCLHAVSESTESPLPLPILVSDVTEQLSASARSRNSPQEIQLPVAISGVLDRSRAADFFLFNVRPGQGVAFRVDSMKLGYMLDPALAIYDLNGNQIAYQDDPAPNSDYEMTNLDPYLVHQFEVGGSYVVMIRDNAQRSHPNYAYRLLVQPAEPDFELRALTAGLTLFRGKTNILPVRAKRFGGWNTPVEVWVENPPPGIKAEKGIAEPNNTPYKGTNGEDMWVDGTNLELHLKVAQDAPTGFYPIRLRARGEVGDKVVEHSAEIFYRWSSVGTQTGRPNEHRASEQELLATVTDLPTLVLETPEHFSISLGKTGKLKVIATRFDDAKTPLTLVPSSLPPGVTLDNNVLSPGANQAELFLKSSETAQPGTYPLVLQAGNISSPPIELKISRDEEK